jgi:hypothetical protein
VTREDDGRPATRCTAEGIEKCFENALFIEREIPRPTKEAYEKIASNYNRKLDREHNEDHGVFAKLDLSCARNISIPEISSVLFIRMMEAGGALYEAIEAVKRYSPAPEPFAEIAGLLESAGAIFTRGEIAPARGQPRKRWRTDIKPVCRWVREAMEATGFNGSLELNPNSVVAQVSAETIKHVRFKESNTDFTADDLVEAFHKLSRDRRKRRPY